MFVLAQSSFAAGEYVQSRSQLIRERRSKRFSMVSTIAMLILSFRTNVNLLKRPFRNFPTFGARRRLWLRTMMNLLRWGLYWSSQTPTAYWELQTKMRTCIWINTARRRKTCRIWPRHGLNTLRLFWCAFWCAEKDQEFQAKLRRAKRDRHQFCHVY